MADKPDMKELYAAAIRKDGCAVADQLNLLGLTDKIHIYDDLQAQSNRSNDAVKLFSNHKKTGRYASASGLAELDAGTTWFGSQKLVGERYKFRTNSSTVECKTYDSKGNVSQTKSWSQQY